jgi:predicted site-specific integrase-resolvase
MKKLTMAEAAQRANVDERVIKEWIEQGKLDCSRVDNFIFIDNRDLQQAISQDWRESCDCMFAKWVEEACD